MHQLIRWLERTNHVDKLELEAELARIAPSDLLTGIVRAIQDNDFVSLDKLWSDLNHPQIKRLFDYFYRQAATSSPVESFRLLNALRGMVAGGRSVLAWVTEDPDGELRWSEEARVWPGSQWWIRTLQSELSSTPPPNFEPETLSVRLPEYREDGSGTIGTLNLQRLPDGSGRLFDHPLRQGLTPVTREFAETSTCVWNVALSLLPESQREMAMTFDYAWWIGGDSMTGQTLLSGGSHGATFGVLAALALQSRIIDPDFTLTGTLLPDGRIGPVAGIREKTRAAFSMRGESGRHAISRFHVPEANLVEAREAALAMGRNPAECVSSAECISELLEEATGLPAQLMLVCKHELRTILDQASTRLRRELSTWNMFDELLVPINVESLVTGDQTESAADARDRVENWKDAFAEMKRCLLLGEPGSGKTTVLWGEAGRLCRSFIESSDVAAPFGLFLPAASLKKVDWPESADGCAMELAMHLLSRRPVKQSMLQAMTRELSRRILDGSVLIAIDALDEVDRESLAALTKALRLLSSNEETRLLLSVRLGSYDELAGIVSASEQLVIHPFDLDDVRSAIRAWFADSPELGNQLLEAIGGDFGTLIDTPHLVWMLCWLANVSDGESRTPSQLHRRVDIFEAFLNECIERWSRLSPVPSSFQKGLLLPIAGEIVLNLFELRNSGGGYDENEVFGAIDTVAPIYRTLKDRDIMRDLMAAGILSRTQGADRPIVFANTVIAEYLAGKCLSRVVRNDGWKRVADWVDDHAGSAQWHEVIVFLAATMEDPEPLFRLLTDPRKDDESRTRLAIAAMCLPDVVQGAQTRMISQRRSNTP